MSEVFIATNAQMKTNTSPLKSKLSLLPIITSFWYRCMLLFLCLHACRYACKTDANEASTYVQYVRCKKTNWVLSCSNILVPLPCTGTYRHRFEGVLAIYLVLPSLFQRLTVSEFAILKTSSKRRAARIPKSLDVNMNWASAFPSNNFALLWKSLWDVKPKDLDSVPSARSNSNMNSPWLRWCLDL